MLKRRLDGKTLGTLFVLLLSLCASAIAQSRSDEWTLNPSDYRYDMSLYLSLASEDYANLDLYEIGAFVGDECRGLAEKLDLPNGGSCLYMRVRSNVATGETLSIKLREKSTGTTFVLKGKDGQVIAFKADEMIGTPSAPYLLQIYFNVTVTTDGHGTVAFENGEYAAGTTLDLNAVPAEGYHFDKWSDGNTEAARQLTVSADMDLMAEFAPNIYSAVFKIDGEEIAKIEVVYGETVPSPEAPAKEGYTFAGWNDIPAIMPAHDVEVTGSYIPNSYNAVFTIDGEVVAAINFDFGAPIVPPTAPEKIGYTFNGWDNLPETMPAGSLEITGSYTVNQYYLTFIIGEEKISQTLVAYGDAITAPEAPAKDGYVFGGWQNLPEMMPARDLDIYGEYQVASYNAVFKVDGEVVATVQVQFGTAITTPEAPVKEGYTFGGWQDLPETMPACDIEVNGSYSINTYKAVFKIDGEEIAVLEVEYNSPVSAPEAPAREGYTFTGWQNVPETMPPFDITIEGVYDVMAYNAVFRIDGDVVATVPFDFGTSVVAPEAPVKEGYTFGGWQDVPATMPAQDIEVNGTYSINTYKAVFKIDGEEIAVLEVEYNSPVSAPEAPAREGYTFTGWQNVPETMPPFDITIEGVYDVMAYNAVFRIDGDVVATVPFDFGTSVVAPEAPVKEGYTFGGWQDVPATMPAQDIEVNGTYSINTYKAVFKIDGEEIAVLDVEYNSPVSAPEAPVREGYTFTGWQNVPETMPPFDITIEGVYDVMAYNAVFRIDGDVVATVPFDFGTSVVAPEAPVKEGYTFGGWQDLPETMPARDIEVNGTYSINTYKAVFKIDGEEIAVLDVEYNSPVSAPEAPVREGYTFTGWQNVPETMPPFDITIEGVYDVMAYNAVFRIDGDVVATVPFDFGTSVVAPEAPVKEGYTFGGWQDLPETMPARDIEINGTYSINTYKAVFKIDGEEIAVLDVEYNSPVSAPEAPVREGYTFTGWQNVPETMPAFDVEILGTYSVNVYTITFKVDNEVVAILSVEYGAVISAPEAPGKEGFIFDGWQNVPETMPAQDIEINGSYSEDPNAAPVVKTFTATFKVDGEVIAMFPVEEGAPIAAPEVPAKEGHTFSGWQNLPETMPSEDITVIGSYIVNTYKATFVIDGEVVATVDVEYNTAVSAPEAPAKEGYTFSGWQNVPETMPPFDVEVYGAYAVNSYTATFMIGEEVIATVPFDFGATVSVPEAPVKEGHTFGGWQNVPETMPADNITVIGSYTVNTYKATFVIDGDVVATLDVEYNTAVSAPEAPAKEGYTFTGWQNIPETMPPFDVEIHGAYAVNTYTATFMIGDEVIATVPVDFGATVSVPEAPVKEGQTFGGWQNVPETMPADNITVIGSYTVNTYKATFVIDGDVVAIVDVEYNTAVSAPEAPAKEGYTFSGWQNVPETMPPFDVEIHGAYAVNSYTATFRIGDEVIATVPVDFGATVSVPEAPVKEGYTFGGWQNVPETMPANDIEILGDYSINSYKATFIVDGEVIAEIVVDYNATVSVPETPVKEGFTFSGWQNVPETMPPFDVQIFGTFAVNPYNVTFMIGDDIVAVVPFEYGAQVTAPEAPVKEGHTFAGWQNVPETMPADNITVIGSYTVDTYKATFVIDGDVVATVDVEYNTAVSAPEAPAKEGYTFTGWQNVPETMPPFDVEIVGTYAVNAYVVTFKIGDEVVAEVPFDFGAPIVVPEAPAKEGHTFAGWQDVPATMPAANIAINGSYTVNTYIVRYHIDDEIVAEISVEYGAAMPLVTPPEKEGHSFGGWENVPETVPAADVDIYGTYILNSYLISFKIGDELIAAFRVNYGATIEQPEAPVKEGYTFGGWQNVPETMPDEDIVINGSYEVNKYILTIYLNDEVYKQEEIAYGTPIEIGEPELPENLEFVGWINEIPETMPARDVDIYGQVVEKGTTFAEFCTDGKQTLTIYTLNGVLLFNEITAADAQKRLVPGFYIINGVKVMVP